ncbi:MULE transposase, conserved domain protein [mine drainage metagenome]|uniref:MULE transposase, conserved domain protein n=1 Tax=mine drainage metagenome TaxID=410659 RepID=T1BL96_9ZZZZ
MAESLEEVVPALVAFKVRFGDPGLIVRDEGAALKGACDRVFPTVPQQLDHFHFLSKAGEHLVREENERLRDGLLAAGGMWNVIEWARGLPCLASRNEEWVGVVARLAGEWVDGTRSKGSSVPFHLPYFEALRTWDGWWRRSGPSCTHGPENCAWTWDPWWP